MAYRNKIALVYLLGFALDLVNMFAATIAYPQIAQQLNASVTQLAWIGNAYMLGLTVIIAPSVWLASVCGEKRLMLGSLLVFSLASALAARAGSIEALIGWRLLQGLGGGLLIPIGQAMAYRHFPPRERARLTSIILLVALLVPALSPALGGLIVEARSWRWVFYANLPLALLALLLAGLWLSPDTPARQRPALDKTGLGLGALGLASLLIGISLLSNSETRGFGLLALLISSASLMVYGRDAWQKPAPLLELKLLKSRLLRVAMLSYLFVPGIFIGTQLVAILYLHELGFSALQTGALMLPWALGSAVGIGLSKYCFNQRGPRLLLLLGMSAQALGIAGLLLLNPQQALLPVALYGLMGLGASLCSSTAQNTAFIDVPAERMGHASALWNINRQLSFCLGPALMMATFGSLSHWTSPSHAFALCFALATALTLLPLPAVWRLNTCEVLALLAPSPTVTRAP